MQKQALDAVNNAVESIYETTKEVVDINSAAIESLIGKQLEVFGQVIDFGVKQTKIFADVKDVQSVLVAQSQLVETAAEQAVDNAREIVKIATKARAAYDKLVNKGVQDAVAAINPKIAKKAA